MSTIAAFVIVVVFQGVPVVNSSDMTRSSGSQAGGIINLPADLLLFSRLLDEQRNAEPTRLAVIVKFIGSFEGSFLSHGCVRCSLFTVNVGCKPTLFAVIVEGSFEGSFLSHILCRVFLVYSGCWRLTSIVIILSCCSP